MQNQNEVQFPSSPKRLPERARLNPIRDQVDRLAHAFDLNPRPTIKLFDRLQPISGSYGLSATVWEKALGSTHWGANERVMTALRNSGQQVKAFRKEFSDPTRLRQRQHTALMFDLIYAQQQSPILIIGAQYGWGNEGESMDHELDALGPGELGLQFSDVGCYLITHPDAQELHIDLPGEEFDPLGDGDFSYAPYVNRGKGTREIALMASNRSNADRRFGSAKGSIVHLNP